MTPDTAPARPLQWYTKVLAVVLAVAAAIYLGWEYYLQRLEQECIQGCIAAGYSHYQYTKPTGGGKIFRQGRCSCVHAPAK